MTRTLILAALAAAAVSGPALANDQLARSLGVEPGVYSLSELATLKTLQDGDDHVRIAAFAKGNGTGSDVTTFSSKGVSAGAAQLARSLGVEPGALSVSELVALRSAEDSDDTHRANAIRAGAN